MSLIKKVFTVVSWGVERLDVFAVGSDSALYHNSWAGSSWQNSFDSLDGVITHPPPAVTA